MENKRPELVKRKCLPNLPIGLLGLSCFNGIMAQESLGTLGSNVSFLESGLTTLGVLSAAVTVLARAGLAFESLLRDPQYTLVATNHRLKRNVRGFYDNFSAPRGTASAPELLLVTNITSIVALTLVTTRLDQGCGANVSIGSWELASMATISRDKIPDNCICMVVACDASCAESLVNKWGGVVIRVAERMVLLYSPSCWCGDAHWECSPDGRPRVEEEIRRTRANMTDTPSLANAMSNLPDWASSTMLVSLDDTMDSRLAKMMREDFTNRDEASRNKVPNAILGLLEVGIDRDQFIDSNWETSKWRCFLLHILEIIVMALLTLIFKIDPFTTSLAARRVVVSYVASESGRGPYAGHFCDKLQVWRSVHSIAHTYVWNVPALVNVAYTLVMAINAVVWLAITGFWLADVSGAVSSFLYNSSLYSKPAGALAWSLAGVGQAYACVAEAWLRHNQVSPSSMMRRIYYAFPRWELCSSLIVVILGIVLPHALRAREGIVALTWVATLWGSALSTWLFSVYMSEQHIYNSLPPSTGYTLYYSAAFIKLATLTAGSGAWR